MQNRDALSRDEVRAFSGEEASGAEHGAAAFVAVIRAGRLNQLNWSGGNGIASAPSGFLPFCAESWSTEYDGECLSGEDENR